MPNLGCKAAGNSNNYLILFFLYKLTELAETENRRVRRNISVHMKYNIIRQILK